MSRDISVNPPDKTPRPRRRRKVDEPFEVHVEFVVLDGPAGKELARRQAAVMRKVLQWIHDRPAELPPDSDGDEDHRDGSVR